MEASEIQEFYAGKTVFLTGATGFLGKLLLEKLLSCTDVKKIYLLVKEKDGKNEQDRVKEMIENSPVFDNLKRSSSEFQKKVCVIKGNMAELNLGMSDSDLNAITNKVNCIFHTAIAAKVTQKIEDAVLVNVRGTRELLNVAKRMKKLKSFVFVSTAFSNCTKEEIDEVLYETEIKSEELIETVENGGEASLVKYLKVTEKWPNSFTFSMAVAEDLIKRKAEKLPISIVRSGSIVATNMGPIRGFIDSCHGPTGVVIGVGLGVLRVFHGTEEKNAEIIPADYVINNAIAAGWAVNEYLDYDKCDNLYTKEKLPVFNSVSSPTNPITWEHFGNVIRNYGEQSPSVKTMWYPYKIVTPCVYNYLLLKFLLHTLPAYILDIILLIIRRKPVLSSFYAKMNGFSSNIHYFMNNSWKFDNANNQKLYMNMSRKDRELFNFNVVDVDWESYMEFYAKGIRVYILKDDMSTVQKGVSRLRALKIAHYTLATIVAVVLYFILRSVLKHFLSFFINL